jgi:hypothetical protein
MQFCVTSYNRQTARFISSLEDTLITFRRIAAGNLSAPLTPAPDTPCASSSTANMQVLSLLALQVQKCKYWRSCGSPQYLFLNTEWRMAGGLRVSPLISSFYYPLYLLYWYKSINTDAVTYSGANAGRDACLTSHLLLPSAGWYAVYLLYWYNSLGFRV